MRVAQGGLLLLSLVLASTGRTQSAPPPVYPPPPPAYPPPPDQYDPTPQAPPRAAGAETHDGFYLRLQLGAGYTRMSSSTKGTDSSIAGTSGGFDLAVGAALNPSLIIYGTFIDSVIRKPTFEASGPDLSNASNGMLTGTTTIGGVDGNTAVVGLGGGVAYYFPSNLFLAGSLLASRVGVEDSSGNTLAKSDWGFTFEGQVGKEWWVSDNWGLGVAGRLLLGAMQDHPLATESVPTWYLTSFSVLFSATYN
jgi:hypothetical protein